MTRKSSAAQRAAELLPVDIGQGSLRKALLREDRERRQAIRLLLNGTLHEITKFRLKTERRLAKRKGDKHG